MFGQTQPASTDLFRCLHIQSSSCKPSNNIFWLKMCAPKWMPNILLKLYGVIIKIFKIYIEKFELYAKTLNRGTTFIKFIRFKIFCSAILLAFYRWMTFNDVLKVNGSLKSVETWSEKSWVDWFIELIINKKLFVTNIFGRANQFIEMRQVVRKKWFKLVM